MFDFNKDNYQQDLERARRLIAAAAFQFAKTMPQTPHFYTLRRKWSSDEDFCWLVMFIRQYGYKEKFGRATYTYFADGGYKYWTMGCPLSNTILINRADCPAPKEAPALAVAASDNPFLF